jgi:hypothetical protein
MELLTHSHCCSLGAFEDPDIIHVDDTVDPVRDLEVITEELRLKVCLIETFFFLHKSGFWANHYCCLMKHQFLLIGCKVHDLLMGFLKRHVEG